MSLDLKVRGNTRRTPVTVYETDDQGNQKEAVLNIEHLRITQDVSEKLSEIVEEVTEEQEAFWKNKELPKEERKELPNPRNLIIEQLCYLVKDPDVIDNGEKLAPTRETFSRVDANVLLTILNSITGTVLPEKKQFSTSQDSTHTAVG